MENDKNDEVIRLLKRFPNTCNDEILQIAKVSLSHQQIGSLRKKAKEENPVEYIKNLDEDSQKQVLNFLLSKFLEHVYTYTTVNGREALKFRFPSLFSQLEVDNLSKQDCWSHFKRNFPINPFKMALIFCCGGSICLAVFLFTKLVALSPETSSKNP